MEGGNNKSKKETSDLYRECLRNHAANLGSYATDGCGEFTLRLGDSSSPGGGSLQCAACGCHRNFHRKVIIMMSNNYNCISSPSQELITDTTEIRSESNSKRFRTKFTAEQKEKMMAFAHKLGWKLQRKELDDEVETFCRGVGVSRQVFKVWMHNHKNSSSSSNYSSASTANAPSLSNH